MAIKRREFIQLSVAGGAAAAALASCSRPVKGLLGLQGKPDPAAFLRPSGISSFHPTLCRECPASCGVIARRVDGRVVGLKGNPRFPTNGDSLCMKGMASLQRLYHPDRLLGAAFEGRSMKKGDAVRLLARKMREASSVPGGVAILSGTERGLTRGLWQSLGQGLKADPVAFRQESLDVVQAHGLLTGRPATTTLDLAHCAYVLSLGAPLLEASAAPAPLMRAYGRFRQGQEVRGRLVQVEPRFSVTAMKSDEWIPCAPGTYGVLALAIAAALIRQGAVDEAAVKQRADGYDAFSKMVLSGYLPEKAGPICGVPAATIEALARDLAAHRPSAVVGGGSVSLPWSVPQEAAAVLALNLLLLSQPGAPTHPVAAAASTLPASPLSDDAVLDTLTAHSGSLRCVLIVNDDPLGRSTRPEAWRAVLKSLPFSACLSLEASPTTEAVRLVLPAAHPFESFQDDLVTDPEGGLLWGYAEPVLAAPPETLSPAELALALASETGQSLDAAPGADRDKAFQGWAGTLLAEGFTTLPGGKAGEPAPPNPAAALSSARKAGGLWMSKPAQPAQPERWNLAAVQGAPSPASKGAGSDGSLSLYLYEPMAFAGANGSSLPFLLEVADPLGRELWGTFVELSPADAAAMGVAEGDAVAVEGPKGEIRAKARVFRGLLPGVAAMAVCGPSRNRFARGLMADPLSIVQDTLDASSHLPNLQRTTVRIRKA